MACRFDYGDTDSSGNQSFVQLISTTDLDEAWPDFKASRAKALAAVPQTIDPATLVQLANSDSDNSTSTDDNISGADSTSSPVSTPTAAPSENSDDKLYSLVEKYGPVVIGLLAGNILIGVLLCIIGLTACMRGVVKGGAKTRNIGSSYAPVRFKEAEAHGDRESEYHD